MRPGRAGSTVPLQMCSVRLLKLRPANGSGNFCIPLRKRAHTSAPAPSSYRHKSAPTSSVKDRQPQEGMADIENGRVMKRDTIFRLYSQTKPVTAAFCAIHATFQAVSTCFVFFLSGSCTQITAANMSAQPKRAVQDGKEICDCQEGMADIENGRVMKRDTIFRLYSQT